MLYWVRGRRKRIRSSSLITVFSSRSETSRPKQSRLTRHSSNGSTVESRALGGAHASFTDQRKLQRGGAALVLGHSQALLVVLAEVEAPQRISTRTSLLPARAEVDALLGLSPVIGCL